MTAFALPRYAARAYSDVVTLRDEPPSEKSLRVPGPSVTTPAWARKCRVWSGVSPTGRDSNQPAIVRV